MSEDLGRLDDLEPEEILEMYPEELEHAIQRAEAEGRKYWAAALRSVREHVRKEADRV